MKLTEEEIEQIYKDWKDKQLDLTKMKEMYLMNIPDDAILYTLDLDFYRGGSYSETGIISKEQKRRFEYHYSDKNIDLGEVNGQHSEVTCELSEFEFDDSKDRIREYLKEHGYDEFKWIDGEIKNYLYRVDCGKNGCDICAEDNSEDEDSEDDSD